MLPTFTVASHQEATPIILRSRVVAIDSEYDASKPVSQATLHGISMAGGTPEEGFTGCFWSFKDGREDMPWAVLKERVLLPIFGDPERTVVMHPPKTEMQVLRARGLSESLVRCKIECTMSQAHVYDENLPKGLKELAKYLLGVHSAASYNAVQKEIASVVKAGTKLVKAELQRAWEHYRDFRKSADQSWPTPTTWDSLQQLVMTLPQKLTRARMEGYLRPHLERVILKDHEDRAHGRFAKYGAEDALFTLGIRYFFVSQIPKEDLPHLELETTICHPIVTEMEERGLKIDVPRLAAIETAMTTAIDALRAEIIEEWGEGKLDAKGLPFNPRSPEQVQQKLWVDWGLSPPPWAKEGGGIKPKFRAGKLGLCTTDGDVIEWLGEHAPAPYAARCKKLTEFKSFDKLLSSFVQPLMAYACADPEHRVHASFWHVGARTSRFSCSDPNVETIPRPSSMPKLRIPPGADPEKPPPGVVVIRDKKTKEVKGWRVDSLREVFIAPTGYKLVSVDASQIENRFMAHESQDPKLLYIFRTWDCFQCKSTGESDVAIHVCPKCGAKEGKRDKFDAKQPVVSGFVLGRDIHSSTAVFAGYNEKYGPEEGRERAKTLNHSFSYGMGAATKARRDGSSVQESERDLAMMHRTYVRMSQMQDEAMQQIASVGYVSMFDGRKRRFTVSKLLMDSGNFKKWETEGTVREAVNVKAQGATAVMMKRAMIALRKRLRANPRYRDVYVISQIHDELLAEAPAALAQEVKQMMIEEVENAVRISVPILASGGTGPTWGSAK